MVHLAHDISYKTDTNYKRNRLDVYYSNKDSRRDVLVFIPGNAWKCIHKNRYKFIGRNFVRKGLVTVIINYDSSSNQIDVIAQDCTEAIIWIYQNISNYNGNPNRIFVMGYSCGGHLIEFINTKFKFFKQYHVKNPIHGIILLNGFGLDMEKCLGEMLSKKHKHYKKYTKLFSNDPEKWRKASPTNYCKNIRNPHLFLIDESSDISVQTQNRHLFGILTASEQAPAEFYEIPRRTHVTMLVHMFFRKTLEYDIILNFIGRY